MRLPLLLHRPHSERVAAAIDVLDFSDTALFALSAAARRQRALEWTDPSLEHELAVARARIELLEAAIATGAIDPADAFWSMEPAAFEPPSGPSGARALECLSEVLFLLRDAVVARSKDLLAAVPGLALACVYAQIDCAPRDCSAGAAEICAAHADAVREERAQLEDLERIGRYRGERAELARELVSAASDSSLRSLPVPIECGQWVCAPL